MIMSTQENKFLRWIATIGATVVGAMLITFFLTLSHIDVIEENVDHNKESIINQSIIHEKDARLIRDDINEIKLDTKEIKDDIKELLKK